ncbi:MAG: PAS domain-containing protein [Eubacterium sp.]|nr:PAS domain-containing protein [Eubacterium sp.]
MDQYEAELYEVMWGRFYKILHCNLTDDTYGIVKDDEGEEAEAFDHFSAWLSDFVHKQYIFEPDMEVLDKEIEINELRRYFKEHDKPWYLRYWRKQDNRYEPVVLELDKSKAYRDDNQKMFLTAKRSISEARVDLPEHTILRQIKKLYSVLSYVDFQANYMHVYKGRYVQVVGRELEFAYTERMEEYVRESVHEKDRARMYEMVNPAYLMEQLKKKEVCVIDYEGKDNSFYRAIYIRTKKDGTCAVLCEANRTKERENELARIEAEDNYRAIHNIIKSGMWNLELDENGTWLGVTWSEEFRKMLGYVDEHDFPNTVEAWSSKIYPDDWDTAYNNVDRTIQDKSGKKLYDVEYRMKTKKQGWRWFRATGEVVRRVDGSPVRFYGVFLDITDQKERMRLEQERLEALQRARSASEEMATIYATLGSGNWNMEFDEHGNVVNSYWSPDLKLMLGYVGVENKTITPAFYKSLVHPDDVEAADTQFYEVINDYTGEKSFDIEYRLRTKQKGYRWFRAAGRATRREDGTPIIFYGVLMDVQDRKQMDDDLKFALEEAQYANRSKTTFLNNMSHDIRTPMNAIIGFINLAEHHLDDTELIKDYLKKIKVSSNHLLSLINDVLDMSRIESGRIYIEEKEVSVLEIMRDLVSMIQLDAKYKKIKLTTEEMDVTQPWVWADALRLKQILMNLLSNAVKFTPQGGHIAFKLMQLPEEDDDYAAFSFHVIDDGIGMSEEFARHAFEPFEREQTATVSGIQGTGLGLTISKNITEMLGGTIQLHSKQGKGTHFTLFFRFRKCQPQEIEDVTRQRKEEKITFSGKRLLLVEDNDLNREIATEILKEAGFEVDTAEDGDVAVEIMKSDRANTIDAILMDIQMPRLDGYEATRQIRAIEGMEAKPIIAMTANAFLEDKQKALNAGMNGHVAKPVDVEILMKILSENL